MDLKNFRHALALAEAGNFVRAAQLVHLTQSALSRSIQALERDLGVQLFDRISGGIKPTAAGKLSSAHDILCTKRKPCSGR
jgi:DNA-binding transcriptional LysR family regulator